MVAKTAERRTYTPSEAARYLGCTRQHLYALLEAGQVPGGMRVGGRWYVGREAFDRWINGEQSPGGSASA
jgi:excisionase family DNA binding protein